MIDNRWGGILRSIDTGKLSGELRKSLISRLSSEDSFEALKLLYEIREQLQKEISTGRRIPEEIQILIEELSRISFADDLISSMDRFLVLVAELYNSHASVSSIFSLAQSFFDRLVTVAFNHSVALLEEEGKRAPGLRFSVLVSGELGRIESVTGSRSSFLLIHTGGGGADNEYVRELAMRFMAVLIGCFPSLSRNLTSSAFFWYGSDAQWREVVENALDSNEPDSGGRTGSLFSCLMETLADMRVVCGDPLFGQHVIDSGRKLLADCIDSEKFWHLAKDISAMPVALGLFGRFKTVKRGKNRGKLDLKGMVIDPLASSVRILSLPGESGETSFTGRIKWILSAGNMGVALADRIFIAYQDFMRERIRIELAGKNEANGLFFNPDQLDEVSRERFRAGLEDVTTVQRLAHQQLVEM